MEGAPLQLNKTKNNDNNNKKNKQKTPDLDRFKVTQCSGRNSRELTQKDGLGKGTVKYRISTYLEAIFDFNWGFLIYYNAKITSGRKVTI